MFLCAAGGRVGRIQGKEPDIVDGTGQKLVPEW